MAAMSIWRAASPGTSWPSSSAEGTTFARISAGTAATRRSCGTRRTGPTSGPAKAARTARRRGGEPGALGYWRAETGGRKPESGNQRPESGDRGRETGVSAGAEYCRSLLAGDGCERRPIGSSRERKRVEAGVAAVLLRPVLSEAIVAIPYLAAKGAEVTKPGLERRILGTSLAKSRRVAKKQSRSPRMTRIARIGSGIREIRVIRGLWFGRSVMVV